MLRGVEGGAAGGVAGASGAGFAVTRQLAVIGGEGRP
jgi:hypothetical protein